MEHNYVRQYSWRLLDGGERVDWSKDAVLLYREWEEHDNSCFPNVF